METTVFHVVHMFSERAISAVPILDENGVVKNIYETLDVTVGHKFKPFLVST
jgi:CBS domain-containing protein